MRGTLKATSLKCSKWGNPPSHRLYTTGTADKSARRGSEGGGKCAKIPEESSAHTQTTGKASPSADASPASLYFGRPAHTQRRAGRRKLPFTYRTFGARSAQAQSHQGQHAGYVQHLHGRDSGRRGATSLLFSPPSLRLLILPPLSDAPSPFFILPSSRRVRKTVRWLWRQRGTEEPSRCKIHRSAPHRTAPRRGWFLLRRDRRAAHPGTRASDVTGRKGSGASSPLSCRPTTFQSSILPSISFPPPSLSPPRVYHLPSLPAHSSAPRRGMKSAE